MTHFQFRAYIAILIICFFCLGCKSDKKKQSILPQKDSLKKELHVVDVITRSMEFQMADTIPSGWNTFRYNNLSNETHFFIFEKLPVGIRIENYKNELIPPFEKALEFFDKGNMDEGLKALENIPAWFDEVTVAGGVGLISPKRIAETTIQMHPGIYAMECYIRMPNGKPHAFLGMLKEIIVSENDSGLTEPTADFHISISSTEGISIEDTIVAGKHRFGVTFKDQKKYETLLGHDVNLIKLDNFSKLEQLNIWLNAADITALRSPAPSGISFLGGVNDSQAGTIAYFTADLVPGNYAFVAEVPNAMEKGMMQTFTID